MEQTEQNEGKSDAGLGASGGSGEFEESAGGAGSGRWSGGSDQFGGADSGSGRGVGSQKRNVFGHLKDRAEDGWGWARRNPWPVVGAAIGIGLLLAWRRRGDASHRLAQMNADHPVGRPGQGTHHVDEVAEGMSEASSR
jgi:hypothetical protein